MNRNESNWISHDNNYICISKKYGQSNTDIDLTEVQ